MSKIFESSISDYESHIKELISTEIKTASYA